MDDGVTITVSEDLRQRAADLAATRGVTVENVVREAIVQYVIAHSPEKPLPPATSAPSSSLGARLRVLRHQILDEGMLPLGWEELQREMMERRGERDHASSYLR